jgi:hypothetical protein
MKKTFFITPIIKNGKPTLLIRRSFSNQEEINVILKDILKNGKINIDVEVSFKDPLTAKIRLKKLGMLPTD